ncbi:MAG TPA: DoxX family protein [Xanthobacteraceae bacterium]|nr:DoxX family protein [Xanthobacteraceae bacterium]
MSATAASPTKITASSVTSLTQYAPYALSLLRFMAGLLFLEHGMAKILGFPPHGAMPVFPEIEFFAGCVELIGGSLITVGLFTRIAALLTSGEMAIGYFLDHFPRSFFPLLNGGDAAVLYCFIFFYLIFSGGGPLSLDALVWRNR